MALTIGNTASDRGSAGSSGYTWIDKLNPASGSGTITKVEVWANTYIGNMYVGIFYFISGTTYKCRSAVNIGSVATGLKKTFDVSLACVAGDFIGFYFNSGTIERDDSGGNSAGSNGYSNYCVIDSETTYNEGFTRLHSIYGYVVGENITIIPGTLALTTTKYAPVVKAGIVPSTRELTITTYAPTVLITGVTNIPRTAIGTTASYDVVGYNGLYYGLQQKIFEAVGRIWAFYTNNNIVFRSSVDGGVTWSAETTFLSGSNLSGRVISLCFGGGYVHTFYNDSAVLKYKRGTPNADGSISWGSACEVYSDSGDALSFNSIVLDSDGYPCVVFENHTDGTIWLSRSSTKDGTWTTENGFPIEVADTDEVALHTDWYKTYPASYWNIGLTALTNRKLYIAYSYEFGYVWGKLFDESLDADELTLEGATSEDGVWSISSYNDTVYVASCVSGQSDNNIKINTRTTSWGTPESIGTASKTYQENTVPVVRIFGGAPCIFWQDVSKGTGSMKMARKISDVWIEYELFSDTLGTGWNLSVSQQYSNKIYFLFLQGNPALYVYFAGVEFGSVLTPTNASLTLTTYISPIIEGTVITPITLSLTTTKYTPVLHENIPIPVKELDITEFSPVVDFGIITQTLGLTLTKYAIVLKLGIAPPTKELVLTSYAPVLNETATPTTLSLTLTIYEPTIDVSGDITVVPYYKSLTITRYVPLVKRGIIPATLSLVITGYAPTVTSSSNINIIPLYKALTLTKYTPVLKSVIISGLKELTLTTYAPSVTVEEGLIVTPGLLSLVLTGYAPSLEVDVSVTPPTLSLAITTYAPTLTQVSSITVTPSTLALTITTYVPSTSYVVYEYSLVSGEHNFFVKAYLKSLVLPNKVIVSSETDDDPQYSGYATSAASFALIPKTQPIRMYLESNEQGTSIAEAVIKKLEINSEQGYGAVPMNVGAEIYDYVKIIDARAGDTRYGNVGWIHERYSVKDKKWQQTFGFGKPQIGQTIDQLLQDIETYSDAGQVLQRLTVKDLYAESIHADNMDFVWLDPDNTIDLSQIGDTLDSLPDGEVYARVKSLHLDAGGIKIDENIIYSSGYDPTTKLPTGTTLDGIAEGTTYKRVKSAAVNASGLILLDQVVAGTYGLLLATDISAGHIKLTSGTAVDGTWYNTAGVKIDSTNGITIYGSATAFRTRATENGTDQCYMDSSGAICAGAGAVKLSSTGIVITGDGYMKIEDGSIVFFNGVSLIGSLMNSGVNVALNSIGLTFIGGGAITINGDEDGDINIEAFGTGKTYLNRTVIVPDLLIIPVEA